MEKSKKSKKQNTELTFEKLKTYPGFENITEAESVKQIDSIKRFAKLLYSMYKSDLERKAKDKSDPA